VVPAHDGHAFGRRRGRDRAERPRTRTVDEPRQHVTRAQRLTGLDRIADGDEKALFPTHISDRRDAACQIRRRPIYLRRVRVHVPQAGNDRLAVDVDDRDIR
jgi:hypothetical protein